METIEWEDGTVIGKPIHPRSYNPVIEYIKTHEGLDYIPVIGIVPILVSDRDDGSLKSQIKIAYHCVCAPVIGAILSKYL
jgi:hypothetical protein